MLKCISRHTIAGAVLTLAYLSAGPALALSPVTFVSGRGTDSGTCASPATPCRTFQFALGQTSPGGEIKARDPADYGSVTITKSVSITGVEGAGIFRTIAGDAITINAGATDTINLSYLTLDAFATARHGIVLNSGGSLTITNCVVRDFDGFGIFVNPSSGNTTFLIADTVSSKHGTGIRVEPQRSGSAQGTLDHVLAYKNDVGIFVGAHATVLAVYSAATNNSFGFDASAGAVLRLAHSAGTGNSTGINVTGTTESAGDNFFNGNTHDVSGVLTKFGAR
jgi:hypothetical protein